MVVMLLLLLLLRLRLVVSVVWGLVHFRLLVAPAGALSVVMVRLGVEGSVCLELIVGANLVVGQLLLLLLVAPRASTVCLLLFQFQLLLLVHFHVALLLVAPGELSVASITFEGFLPTVGPLVGLEVVAAAELAHARLVIGNSDR